MQILTTDEIFELRYCGQELAQATSALYWVKAGGERDSFVEHLNKECRDYAKRIYDVAERLNKEESDGRATANHSTESA